MLPIADSLPSWRDPAHPTAHDRFRHIFRDHWHTWCDLRLADEVPPDQRAYVCKTVERMILCRDPNSGYALYICPGCKYEHRAPFSCKTRFCPSCGKVRVDHWVNDIARDLYDVPHLHVTLTTDDLLWPFSFADRPLLKVLLKTAAQACPERSRRAVRELAQELYPGVRIGMIYTVHTGGRDLGFKPHVHPSTLLRAGLVMTKGGLKDGKWVESDRLPGNQLSARWRYLLCKHLFPLFDLEPLAQTFQHLTWRERIKQSFGYDPLECPRCGCIMQLAEIWQPKRGHLWMRRWLDTHRMRTAARQALERIRARHHRYHQLAFDFNFES